MDAYQKGPIIGEGTYGSVICATHKVSGRQVAIKKVRMASSREGVNMSVLRELKALQALQGPHVVQLLDVFTTKSSLVLVFEYMDCSLEDVIRDKATQLSPGDVKAYMQMLLQGLAHVHAAGVVHRDVKPDNMLVGSNSALKLADFGLARSLEEPCCCSPPAEACKLTPQVFGRWYRPPELLMGCCHYSFPVDMWAVGCVLAELLLRQPWFPGVCDMDQLDRIFKALGVPTVESWPGLADLPHRIDFKPAQGQPLQQIFPQASPDCLDLLQQLMQFDPQRRISAAAALQHPYFSSSPPPTPAAELPRPATSSRGRRDAATVPALMQDLLVRPAMMVQRQQEDAPTGFGSSSGSSRQLFAFSGQSTSFSGRFFSGQGLQQGWPVAAATAAAAAPGAEGMLSGGLRLVRSMPSAGLEAATVAANGLEQEQLGHVLEEGPALPWKGRLSFGSTVDEPAAAGAAAAGDQQQDAAAAAGGSIAENEQHQQQHQQQHLLHRRPSPAQLQQQQQGGKSSSMRPPLHRNPAAAGQQQQHAGSTPLNMQPGSSAAGAAGSGDSHAPCAAGDAAAGHRRRVSDLAATLSSAAAAAASDGMLDSLLARSQRQGAAALLHNTVAAAGQAGLASLQTETPAVGIAVSRCGDGAASAAAAAHGSTAGSAADDVDMACPMSLGTSAYKRSRAVFESAEAAAALAAGSAGGAQQQDGSAAADAPPQHQQGQQGAAMCVSGGFRRAVRGRRSSMGSGSCCSMDTDGGPASAGAAGLEKRQQGLEGSVAVAAAGAGVPRAGSSIGSQLNQLADRAAGKEQEVEALLGGSQQQQQQQHALSPQQARQKQQRGHHQQQQQQQLGQEAQGEAQSSNGTLLQLVHPWPVGSAAAGQRRAHAGAAAGAAGMAAAAGDPAAGSFCLAEMSQAPEADVVGLLGCSVHQQHQQPADSGGCSMSLDQRPTTAGRRHSMHSVHGQQQQHLQQQQQQQHLQQQQQRQQQGQQQLCGHYATGLIAPGASASSSDCMRSGGCSSMQASGGALSNGFGAAPGFGNGGEGLGFGGLAAMNPADLAELASWWRPRLDSAERRYLRCRKQQMDEALLQASQQDDDEARDTTLGSPDLQPRGVLFGSPLGDSAAPAAAAAGAAGQQAGAAAAAGAEVDGEGGRGPADATVEAI